MRKRFAVLLVSVALGSAVGAFRVDPLAQSASPPATMLRVPGTIDKYDVSRRVLFLSTSSGTVQFPLTATTRILRDGQRVELSELAKLSGRRAAVRYSESGGNKTVESVHVFAKD